MKQLKHSLHYLFWGMLSNGALKLYYHVPREYLQEELILLHRHFLKKAHDARMRGEHERQQNT